MNYLDLTILVIYLVGTVLFGAWFSRSHRNLQDYFVSGHRVPWWAIMGSIVATETSTVTFISVPGYAYGGNFTFMQLVIGYMIGRLTVTILFVPSYFKGEMLTVYQLLGQRFGSGVRRLASALFLITRTLADGVRLFATGLVLAALLLTVPGLEGVTNWLLPGMSPTQASLVISILVMGIATIIYTYLGGMSAVIWTEFVQLVIYLAGALIAAWVLLGLIPGGWETVVTTGTAEGKFNWFDFTFDLTRSYTFWSGVIGGAFLTTATHGTDQLMVQRYLCSRSTREARIALMTSGGVIFVQFMLFLLIGVMLFVYYRGELAGEIAGLMVNGRVQSDRIFPQFIVQHLPAGILGLVVAAIFAAAMSTLASSLNSSAATAIGDFYLPLTKGERSDRHYLRVSKFLTALWGCLQIAVALAAIQFSRSAVDEVLGIASFTNGVILGVFFLGTLTKRVGQQAAFVGVLFGATVMLFVKLRTGISWQWYVLIGSITTFLVGYAASWSRLDRTRAD